MRRGKANVKKPKTENEAEIAPENDNTAETEDHVENEQDSAAEGNKTDTTQKRKPKRGKTEETASADTENAEPPEKKEKRVPKKAKNATEAAAEEGEEEYEVEKIVDMKEIRGKRQFKIHWKGYGPENETWEKETDLNCPELIKEFLDQLPEKTKKKPGASKASKKKAKDGLGDANSQTELQEYEVAEVMQMQRKKGKRVFLVHWKGFSHDEDTWEPEENLNCAELIEEFLKKTKADDKTTKRVAASDKGRRRQGKSKKKGYSTKVNEHFPSCG